MTQHTSDAQQLARRAARSDRLAVAARLGYAVNGVMHLLIGAIALQLGFVRSTRSADHSGALATLAGSGLGRASLWVGVVGFLGLAIWQAGAGLLARGDGPDRAKQVAKALGKAVVYAALAVTTWQFARGGGSSSSGLSKDFTATVLQQTGGRALVVLVGVGVLAVGAYHVVKGVTRRFLRDLVEHPGAVVEWLAVVGYVAKGVALGVVGLLFVVAGLRSQPASATGLDGALDTLRQQPYGTVLVVVVALGIIAYGVYSFARARYARL